MRILRQSDVDPTGLAGETVAVIGYGSQGRAQALNLRDSGIPTLVGLRPGGSSWEKARADGFEPLPVAEACRRASLIQVLVPDTAQPDVYAQSVAPHLENGDLLLFSHGFNIHYGNIRAPEGVDVGLVAPKAPGPAVRRTYLEGTGVPALFAVHADATGRARTRILAYAHAIGSTRIAVFETTFKDETETDLFGEQAVLCGGVSALVEAGFETLVAAGYPPEMAYFECVHELKLIVDLIHAGGLTGMRRAVSDTAEYGDYTRGPRVIDPSVRARMEEILQEVRSGAFAKEWMAEHAAGLPNHRRAAHAAAQGRLERVGAAVRAAMSGEVAK